MSERNPNHPVTRAAHDQWHKIAALLMFKFRAQMGSEVVITEADVVALAATPGGTNIVLHEKADGLHLRLVDDDDADRLVAKEG